jgi:hypothetical protein
MAGIGHFDFGANFRPVDFGGWLDRAKYRDPGTIAFWVEYWTAAYEDLSDSAPVTLVCYEDLCSSPVPTLQRLADRVEVRDRDALLGQASRFRLPPSHAVDVDEGCESLVKRAEELYVALRAKALPAGAANG